MMKKALSVILAAGLLASLSTITSTIVVAAPIPDAAIQSAHEVPPPVAKNDADFDKALLDDVDGVSLQLYTRISYNGFYKKMPLDNDDALKAEYNITKAQFDKANEIFSKRMQDDKSFKFINLFGAYFWDQAGAGGKNSEFAKDYVQSVLNDGPLYLDPPMTMTEYSDLMRYYGNKIAFEPDMGELAASDRVLKDKGYTFEELQIIGAWLGRATALGMGIR
ncbi:hypothetical protein [Bartonella sp. HY038]|uniref:hypothetical protein n=1 Tax=Bartonella sp. HY038 TaxID=2759660 RepID=UPI0015FB8FF1|nr:hypothetical protein [Bartonella sp. HY038]